MNSLDKPVVVVRAAVAHVPEVPGELLLGAAGSEKALDPDEAHLLLGRKGLLYKEPATRLALCAVHRAFDLPPGRPKGPVEQGQDTAVVVSSNYGNVQTVRDVVATVRAGSGRDVSPLQAPNASSNVIASTLAIRYGLAGPNLMVCSGAVSGHQALYLGALLLRTGRARRAVVVGVEPVDDTVRVLAGRRGSPEGARTEPREGAACVVLEAAARPSPGEIVLGAVTQHRALDVAAAGRRGSDVLRLVSPGGSPGDVDLSAACGDTYGALGVLQAAAATAWLRERDAARAVLVAGDEEDGWARAELSRLQDPTEVGV
ncbi:beta-ketoacyl synthase N-terminal-like domain-containing protein [Streptacidiphilus neutrinimicus]|uniref:beta-ketoacyl synthase N-terminal-like domain-containing protein n=1 Tax=Streptacidiphilus neutrinimicus TaxID=105420 RepID=UPI00069496A1|nr:beta-ketoacyl synthase N-terminal-like domain-containing protein [Streptacidiphilus neutrinimicus]